MLEALEQRTLVRNAFDEAASKLSAIVRYRKYHDGSQLSSVRLVEELGALGRIRRSAGFNAVFCDGADRP